MILKSLLNIQTTFIIFIWMIFIKILSNTIQTRNTKYCFNDTVVEMFSNKRLNPTVTELFIKDRKLNISLVFNI